MLLKSFSTTTAVGEPVEEAPMRLPRNPSDPTPDEREKQNKTHAPHRPWCAVCVSARGREDKHYTQTSKEMELGLPMIVLDYAQVEDTTKAQTHEVNAPRGEEAPSKPHKRRLMIGRDRWTNR